MKPKSFEQKLTSKRLLTAGQNDRTNRRIVLQLSERGAQLAHQLVVQSVQRLRSVQSDQADLATFLDQNVVELLAGQASLQRVVDQAESGRVLEQVQGEFGGHDWTIVTLSNSGWNSMK